MKATLFRLLPLALALTGCSSLMTGLDGQGGFSCKAPDGISCASLSGVYANAVQNNLPGQRPQTTASKSADGGQVSARLTKNSLQAGDPLLLQPYLFATPPVESGEVLAGDGVVFSSAAFGPLWFGRSGKRAASRAELRSAVEWAANVAFYAIERRRTA